MPPRRRAAAAPPGLIEPLTDRELEVLRLLAAGKSNQRIAHDLVVALDTVKKHVTHVLGKLGAANRTEAVARARRARPDPLTPPPAGPVAPSGEDRPRRDIPPGRHLRVTPHGAEFVPFPKSRANRAGLGPSHRGQQPREHDMTTAKSRGPALRGNGLGAG